MSAPIYSSDLFIWESKNGQVDASELHHYLSKKLMISKPELWVRDPVNNGWCFEVVSKLTGVKMEFYLQHTFKDLDGDIEKWLFGNNQTRIYISIFND